MGAFLVFDGLQYVFGAALRSLGEQVWAGVNGMFGFFLTTGGLGLLFVHIGLGRRGAGARRRARHAGVGRASVRAVLVRARLRKAGRSSG